MRTNRETVITEHSARSQTNLLKGECTVQFLEWNHHIESLEQMSGFHAQEKRQSKEGLLYLQHVLGDDFLQRCSTENPFVARHPILQWLANFAPSSRGSIARFAGHLRILEGSQNLGNVLARLHDITQFNHDALLIKSASRLVSDGLEARFEPTMAVKNNQKQPDLRLDDPLTGETLFLEVSTQTSSQKEREVTDTNSAVFAAVFGPSYDLSFSGRWYSTPSTKVLSDILERIKCGAARARSERTIVTVEEEGIFEMALCHRDDKTSLLDPWSAKRGLSGCGFVGPVMSSNDTVRIKWKIRNEQVQLPRDGANVIVILATDAFLRAGGVRRVMSEVEVGVFEYEHIHLVIVHGEYIDDREVPFTGSEREHQYTRRIVDGMVESDLLLVNQHSRTKLSTNLIAKFRRFF